MDFKTKILKAGNGDAILVSFKDDQNMISQNILIDGGGKLAYQENLKVELINIVRLGECIDLLIVTHIDQDHIGGINKLFDDIYSDKIYYQNANGIKEYLVIKKIWYNSNSLLYNNKFDLSNGCSKISKKQGVRLQYELDNIEGLVHEFIVRPEVYNSDAGIEYIGNLRITILSPTKSYLLAYNQKIKDAWDKLYNQLQLEEFRKGKISSLQRANNIKSMKELINVASNIKQAGEEENDLSPENLSSIAILIEYNRCSLLLLADSPHETICESLRDLGFSEKVPLKADYVKLSHHAGVKNTSFELLSLIDCKNYIISSDGQSNDLPNKMTLAKVILANNSKVNFFFNYPASNYNFSFYDNENEMNEQDIYNFTTSYSNIRTGLLINHGNKK